MPKRILTDHLLSVAKQREALGVLTDDRRKRLYFTLGILGMRIGEAVHMTKAWLDPEHQHVKIPFSQACTEDCSDCHRQRRYWTKYSNEEPAGYAIEPDTQERIPYYAPDGYWYAKTKRAQRTIPVKQVQEAYAKLIIGEDVDIQNVWEYLVWWFDTFDDTPPLMGRVMGWKVVKNIGRQIDRPDLYPHALRATAATNLARVGLRETDLCTLMGWRHFQTASVYIRLAGTDVSVALERVLGRFVPYEE